MNQYLIAQIGSQKFAFNISQVKEILTYREVNEVPHSNEHVLGILKLRDKIVSIFKPTEMFNVDFQLNTENKNDYKFIIFEDKKEDFGIIVNKVFNVQNINEIQSAPVVNDEGTFISGIYIEGSDIISIIDLNNVDYFKNLCVNE